MDKETKSTGALYFEKTRSRIRIKARDKPKTVIVSVGCVIDPDFKKTVQEFDMAWNGRINWKQGNIKNILMFDGTLDGLVHQVYKLVKDGLIDMMGRIQEVDVVFFMPSGKDHKTTITFKQAMRSITKHNVDE